jgi:hypothetical protein
MSPALRLTVYAHVRWSDWIALWYKESVELSPALRIVDWGLDRLGRGHVRWSSRLALGMTGAVKLSALSRMVVWAHVKKFT